jgi:MFS family permease
VPLVAGEVLMTDSAGFGLLSAAMGIGALIAAMSTAYARKIVFRWLLISGVMFGLFLGVLAFSRFFRLSMVLFIATGLTGIMYATAVNSLLQLNTPEQLRGRVLSINILLTQGSTPVGGFFLGAVVEVSGVTVALLICAALCPFGSALAGVYRWRTAHLR